MKRHLAGAKLVVRKQSPVFTPGGSHEHVGVGMGRSPKVQLWKEARQKAKFTGTLDSLLDILNNIRLATLIEQPQGRGRPKAIYKLEETSEEELALINALGVAELHKQRPKLKGVGVYN